MSEFWGQFDVEEAEEQGGGSYEPLPVGEYDVICASLEEKDNKSGNGMHLAASFTVTDGEYEGRLLFTNFNVIHDNETAQRISRGELARFCKAVGVSNPKGADDVLDKPLTVKVVVKDGKNEIKGYRAAGGAKTVAEVRAEKPASKPANGKKPWQK